MQALRDIVLPNFNSAKCAKQYNITQADLLEIVDDPILLNVISEMCEGTFNVQINCSFERYKNIPEGIELILVEFILETLIDVKHNLKYHAQHESVVLPTGYIENPYKHTLESIEFAGGSIEYIDMCHGYSVTFSNGSI